VPTERSFGAVSPAMAADLGWRAELRAGVRVGTRARLLRDTLATIVNVDVSVVACCSGRDSVAAQCALGRPVAVSDSAIGSRYGTGYERSVCSMAERLTSFRTASLVRSARWTCRGSLRRSAYGFTGPGDRCPRVAGSAPPASRY
jgi:hypothetical protein